MSNFGLIKSDETINVKVRDKSYPVIKAGDGAPCLLICLGTPSFRTLSKKFTTNFTVYSSDMYWIENNALENSESVTMDTIIDDIKLLAEALNLKKYYIFAHSAYGIIALEFAKKYPDSATGIIMVGTPVNSNSKVLEENNLMFNKLAGEERKQIDQERRAQIASEDMSSLTSAQKWLREYVYRDAPRYWHIPDFDCMKLWEDIPLDKLLVRLFEEILPKTDVLLNLEKVKTPVYLAAGVSDYDCCPWVWEQVSNLPKSFNMTLFNQSGHWPHYEEAELFDESVKNWVATVK